MFETLIASGAKRQSAQKPKELTGNYELVTIPTGPSGRMQNALWIRGDEMFIAGGSASTTITDFYALNLKNKSWRKVSNDIINLTGIASAYSQEDNTAYLFGGNNATLYDSTRREYNHTTGVLSTVASGVGGSGLAYANAVAHNGSIYLAGGYFIAGAVTYNHDIRILNLATKQWTTKVNAFAPNGENTGMIVVDDVLYLRSTSQLYSLPVDSSGPATLLSTCPVSLLNTRSMFEFGGDLYMLGRVSDGGVIGTKLVKYSIANNDWTIFGFLPSVQIQLPSVVYWGGALWAWSGMSLGSPPTYPNQLIKIT